MHFFPREQEVAASLSQTDSVFSRSGEPLPSPVHASVHVHTHTHTHRQTYRQTDKHTCCIYYSLCCLERLMVNLDKKMDVVITLSLAMNYHQLHCATLHWCLNIHIHLYMYIQGCINNYLFNIPGSSGSYLYIPSSQMLRLKKL